MKNSVAKSMAMRNISKDKYKKYGLEKRLDRLMDKSFNNTLLDRPVHNYKSQNFSKRKYSKIRNNSKITKTSTTN